MMTDHFSVYVVMFTMVLRCDICHARDHGFGDVYAWDTSEDMNLTGIVSHAGSHWASIHEKEEA